MLMTVDKKWNTIATDTDERMAAASPFIGKGKEVHPDNVVSLLEAVIRAGDCINIEGNNQKQADFLAECLNKVDKGKIHDLHMVQSSVPLASHLDLFENGIAKKLDFAYAGPMGARIAKFIREGTLELGAIHTYLELFGRYFLDLTPRVSLICAYEADREGNLYTGFNTEDTPVIVEATKFKKGIVIAQVNKIVDKLPRVDIPADWVDAVVESPKPFFLEPLFTRDPGLITEGQILLGMLALKGIYKEYETTRVNHGAGFLAATIELLLPTYGASLDLKGKICTHMMINPHPTMIPAIEEGWTEVIYGPGGEVGMEEYVLARPDVFCIGADGTMRNNRAYSHVLGHYGLDMFIGGTLQIDPWGNSSTATASRVAGFGGAPNLGCDAKGRRHVTNSWLKCGKEFPQMEGQIGQMPRGKKLVVQGVETFGDKRAPTFVEELDAWKLAENAKLELPPVMIYGDDVTHIVTEEGIAYLSRCPSMDARMAAIRAVAGVTEVGLKAKPEETRRLREEGIFKTPADLGIKREDASRDLLAAKSLRELVAWSGGLYNPPARFRNW